MARPAGVTAPPGASVAQAGARDALRTATREVHERLHGLPLLRRLAQGTITRDEYGDLLGRMLVFHGLVENRLAEGPSLKAYGIALPERSRVTMLRQDLRTLGRPVPADRPDHDAPLAVPSSAADALGMLYVTEGATLGGRILSRSLNHLLGEGVDGRRFLLGHGDRNGGLWRGLCAAIDACGADATSQSAMVATALRSFAWFGALMTPEPELSGA